MTSNFHGRIGAAVVAVSLFSTTPAAAAGISLTDGIGLMNQKEYEKAAPIFFDVAENSGQQELQFRSEYFLALSLYSMGLYHSALYYDSLIVDEGPNHPYYQKAVENMVDVMDAVGDKTQIPFILDKYYNDAFSKLDKKVIDRVNFIVALWDFEQRRSAEEIAAFLDSVKADSPVYPRARYLRGLQFAQEAKSGDSKLNEKAVDQFTLVRKLDTSKVAYADLTDMQQLATLALARIRYAQGKYGDSYKLYTEIPRFSKHWRDALFEGAYAAFMNDDYGSALGLLHTLHSPVAGDQFVPESWLLKGTLYYFDCLFEESRASLGHLQDAYSGQTLAQLKAILGQKHDPEFFYNLLVKGSVGDVKIPANVRNELLSDDALTARRSYVDALATEAERLKSIPTWKGSTMQKALVEAVEQQRAKLVSSAGTAVRRGMGLMQLKLEDFDGQAEIVKLEMADREKNLLESSYDSEKLLSTQRLERPAVSTAEYWGFDGEYWPDEIGYYQYTLKNACPPETAESTSGQ
jgi:hypothetical protein